MLDLEPLLIARLTGTMPEDVKVLTANDLVGVREQSQHAPAVHVLYESTRAQPANDKAPSLPTQQAVEQTWAVVAVIRNSASQLSAKDARSNASVLTGQIICALLGWRPGNAYSRLRLTTAPRPDYGPGGVVYFPLLFTTRFVLSGDATKE